MEYLLYPFALIVFTAAFFMIGFYIGQGKERARPKRAVKRPSNQAGK